MSKSKAEKDEFWEKAMVSINLAQRMKAAMIKKNKTSGWTKCPECGGKVNAVLAGPRQHIHMACKTKGCNVRAME